MIRNPALEKLGQMFADHLAQSVPPRDAAVRAAAIG